MFDAQTGEGLGAPKPSWVAPKNASAALDMALLDESGSPVAAGRYVRSSTNLLLVTCVNIYAAMEIQQPGLSSPLTSCVQRMRIKIDMNSLSGTLGCTL